MLGLKAEELTTVKPTWLSFEFSYIGEVASNFSDGIKAGTTYLVLTNLAAYCFFN